MISPVDRGVARAIRLHGSEGIGQSSLLVLVREQAKEQDRAGRTIDRRRHRTNTLLSVVGTGTGLGSSSWRSSNSARYGA